jgi:hypothetical protein
MNAYFYSFQPTGVLEIDTILSAVATAGKAFHHTEEWNEPMGNGETPVQTIQDAAVLAAGCLGMWRDEMRADARREPFFSFYIDGRNEHGTHLLSVPGSSIDDLQHCKGILSQVDDQDEGLAERIVCDAEAMGFAINHAIVTIWKHESDGGGPEGYDYFTYERISWPLTVLLFGTPDEQEASHEAAASEGP